MTQYATEATQIPAPCQNSAFLNSGAGRTARLVCELEEFPRRMSGLGVRGTFLVFGSARTKYTHQLEELIKAQEDIIASHAGKADAASTKATLAARKKILGYEGLRWGAEYMVKTEELCRKLTEWAMTAEGRRAGMFCKSNLLPNDFNAAAAAANAPQRWFRTYQAPIAVAAAGDVAVVPPSAAPRATSRSAVHRAVQPAPAKPTLSYTFEQPLVVCSGGGPGFMEAANKGAFEAGGVSMGVAISLPFETRMNDYVTPGLHFQMDYFFTRKFWEVFSAKTMICCPGGMGTCDEMFEVLTLMQCGHCQHLPVVLLGRKFWTDCINFSALAGYNMISQQEVDDLCITDSVDEAFDFITKFIIAEAAAEEKKMLAAAAKL